MNFKYIKDDNEYVEVHAKEKSEFVNKIEQLATDESSINVFEINGYIEKEVIPIKINEVVSFYTLNDKTYARTMNDTYLIKLRLYQIEEKLSSNFIRINKSRIINKCFILKFDLSWSGTIFVICKNGDKDYVSRRLIKSVKERMNIK